MTKFIDGLDIVIWRWLSPSINAAIAGASFAFDKRNTEDRNPYIYFLAGLAIFQRYDTKNDEWQPLPSPALAGVFGAGAFAVFSASAGPSGVVAAGCTTTSIVLTTPLPAAVGVNQLANRGDGIGYTIRIFGNTVGGSGRTETSRIIGNTAGTTPTLTISPALSFVPASGSRYEILSGRVMLCSAGALAVNIVRAYDIATNSYVAISQVNLPATIGTDSSAVMLDELYVPHNRNPGDGFFGNLTSTATTSTSITGHATGGDAGVLVNEYRNFQIRIVQDTVNPTAVGQRRIITSHTAGASPVYTVPAWTVTPSANAIYVIENNNDLILFSSAAAVVYSYRFGGFTADGTWSFSGTVGTNGAIAYTSRVSVVAAGCTSFPSFSIVLDINKNARHSNIFSFRGGGATTLDLLDISASATGVWSLAIPYGGLGWAFGAGSNGDLNSITHGGRYGYININATPRFARFDVLNRVLEPYAFLPFTQGAAVVGNKIAILPFFDGAIKYGMMYSIQSSGTVLWNLLLHR